MKYHVTIDLSKFEEKTTIFYEDNTREELIGFSFMEENDFTPFYYNFGDFKLKEYSEFFKSQNNLFYLVCDFLSLDFSKLKDDLWNDFPNFKSYKLKTENLSPLLYEPERYLHIYRGIIQGGNLQFINSLKDIKETLGVPLEGHYQQYCLLQMYIDQMMEDSRLLDETVFKVFTQQALHENIMYTIPLKTKLTEKMDFWSYTEYFEGLDDTTKEDARKELFSLFFDKLKMEEGNIRKESCTGTLEYCCTMLYYILSNQFQIKRCLNCGKYFVPYNRIDTSYCDRISSQDPNKTCKEYGKYSKYLQKTRTDEATKLYKQIYNIKANKIRRCENPVLKKDLDEFTSTAKQWKTDIKAGTKTEEEYIAWLKEVKEKKVL